MKRFLIAAGLVAFLPAVALAQGTSAQDAKVGSKNSGASPPAEDKSKRLTRDELRACMLLSDANQAEAVAIKEAQTAYFADLLPAKEALRKQRDWINEEGSALKMEQGELQKAQEALKEQLSKMDKAEAEAAIEAHKARANKLNARIDALNAASDRYNAGAKELNARTDPNNPVVRELNARAEAQMAKVEDWKANCSNRSYDEMDEIVIRREMGKKK